MGATGGVAPRDGLAPFGKALTAYHEGDADARLDLRWDLGTEVSVPVSGFFDLGRSPPGVEREALTRATGSVLDIGAGAGRFSLALMDRGHPVIAVDVLPEAVSVLGARGVTAVRADILTTPDLPAADTVFVMMNGTTHAGTLDGLAGLLSALERLTLPGGRILLDSTDPAHPAVEWEEPGDGRSPGELHLQMGFRGQWAPPMPQLFVGPERLGRTVEEAGLRFEVAAQDEDGRYLAELRKV